MVHYSHMVQILDCFSNHMIISLLPSCRLQGEVTQEVVMYHMISEYSIIGGHRLAFCLESLFARRGWAIQWPLVISEMTIHF